MSQAKLAVRADMDPATLNRLEQGKGNPNLRTLERVADALGVEVADLLPRAQPNLFTAAEQTDREAREAEAAGARMVKLSLGADEVAVGEPEEAIGYTGGAEGEVERLEAGYVKAAGVFGPEDGSTARWADAYAESLAALAVGRGGGTEEVKAAIQRAMAAHERAHAGVA